MMDRPYALDIWYRHESDADRTMRKHAQVTTGLRTITEAYEEFQQLRKQGYEVQGAELRINCARCQSNGRLPKYSGKVRRKLTAYVECTTCQGKGYTHTESIEVMPATLHQLRTLFDDVRALLVNDRGFWITDLSGGDVIEALTTALTMAGGGVEQDDTEDEGGDDGE